MNTALKNHDQLKASAHSLFRRVRASSRLSKKASDRVLRLAAKALDLGLPKNGVNLEALYLSRKLSYISEALFDQGKLLENCEALEQQHLSQVPRDISLARNAAHHTKRMVEFLHLAQIL